MPLKKKKGTKSRKTAATSLLTPSPPPLLNSSNAKRLILIRHGESQGQAAKLAGLDRQRDPNLIDCGLTRKGAGQASNIPNMLGGLISSIDLVISSPLTRALETTLRGFQHVSLEAPILVHYGIREIGSSIPENQVRSTETVQRDLKRTNLSKVSELDFETLKPDAWPDNGGSLDKGSRNTNISNFLNFISEDREEKTIAVICHYNVIRAIAGNGVRPVNAMPIGCWLGEGGIVGLAENQREYFSG